MKTKLTPLLLIGFNLLLNSGCEKVFEKSELNFRNDKFYPVNSDTPYTGRVVSYYENGQLSESGKYIDGIKEGSFVTYHENGQLRTSENWKDGNRDGIHERYFENGQLDFSGNYIDGELEGLSEFYYENGSMRKIR